MKIAIITCYTNPDYVRARVLRTAFAADPRVDLIIVKNRHKSVLRYPEVLLRLLILRFRQQPDAYVITFRGYEILPFVLLIAGKRPVVFDEFINLIEWVVYEHNKLRPRTWPATTLASWYKRWLRRCEFILADTKAHAAYSAALSGVSHSLFRTIPVGTDEAIFKPGSPPKPSKRFEVLYYGSMLPLHGLDIVLAAAKQLADQPQISFVIVGGKKTSAQAVAQAAQDGAHITYHSDLPFKELPQVIRRAQLCLAGPFGDTEQSKLVITGKTYQILACSAPALIGHSNASGVFSDGIDCLLVPQGDADALATKIVWAEQHRQKLAQIAKSGRKLYEQKFSAPAIAKKVTTLVDELTAVGRARG